MRKALFTMAVFAAGFGLTAISQAGVVNGSQSFEATGTTTPDGVTPPTGLLSISNFTTLTFALGAGFNDFSGFAPAGEVQGNSPLNTASLGTFSMGSADFGTFAAASGIEEASPPNTRTFDFLGSFTPGSNAHWTGFTGQSAELIMQFTQTGGSGNAISASATLAVPPSTQTPEPGSITLLGIGAVGMAACAIRRKRQKVAA